MVPTIADTGGEDMSVGADKYSPIKYFYFCNIYKSEINLNKANKLSSMENAM